MTMISGISAAMGAVNSALEQFDRALLTTVTAVEDAGDGMTSRVELPDGLAGMDTARLAAQAALVAANTSISMLDDVIKLGDYNHKHDQDSSQQSQPSSSAHQDSGSTIPLMAFAQMAQSAEPAPPPAAAEEQAAQASAQPE